MAKANEFHSKIEQAWELVGEHFEVWSTCEWDVAHRARGYADKAYPELVRIYGIEPAKKPHFVVLNNLQQYNQAAGNQPILVETEGISSLSGAYFADGFFDFGSKPPQYLGCGVSYWDRKDPKVDPVGRWWARWAARAELRLTRIDPSWSAVADRIADGGKGDLAAYLGSVLGREEDPALVPLRRRVYVERFSKDPDAGRRWRSVANPLVRVLRGQEGRRLHKMDDIFAFRLGHQRHPRVEPALPRGGAARLVPAGRRREGQGDGRQAQGLQTALKAGKKEDVTKAGLICRRRSPSTRRTSRSSRRWTSRPRSRPRSSRPGVRPTARAPLPRRAASASHRTSPTRPGCRP
jgi:hypothetical protein